MRRLLQTGLWLGLGALVWLVAIICLYYIPHKPLSAPVALASARAFLDLTLASLLVALAGGLGRKLCLQPHPDPLAGQVIRVSLGLGLTSLAMLVLGALGLFQQWALWLGLVALLLLLRLPILGWVRDWKQVLQSGPPKSGFVRVLLALGGVVLLASLLEAMAPPVHFDALVYHLALPQEFLHQGRLVFTPDNPFWGMPLGSEMLYTWAMGLGRAQTAAVLGWMVGFLGLAGVVAIGRVFGREVGWVAAVGLLAGETLSASMGWAYADWLVALHSAAMLLALDAWRRRERQGMLVWAGVAAGMAFGAKYSGLLAAIGGGCLILLMPGPRRPARPLMVFVAAAMAVSLPWLVKNAWITGDPLFPFLGANAWMDPARQAFYRGVPFTPPGLTVLLTPIQATLQGVEGAPGYAASLGPLLLGLLPGLAVVRRPTFKKALPLIVFVVAGWLVWAVGRLYSQQLIQSRLYYALFPAWAVLAGVGYRGICRLRIGRVRARRVTQVLISLVLGLAALSAVLAEMNHRPAAAAFGLETEWEYRQRRLGATALALEHVRRLQQASVMLLWEPRGMDCSPVCRPDAWIDRWYLDRRVYGSGMQVLQAWRAAGVTHVLLYRAGMEYIRTTDARYTTQDWHELQVLLDSLIEPVQLGEGYNLYRLP